MLHKCFMPALPIKVGSEGLRFFHRTPSQVRIMKRLQLALLAVALCATSHDAVSQSGPKNRNDWNNLESGLAGSRGIPSIRASRPLIGRKLHFRISGAQPNSVAWVFLGLRRDDLPLLGGTLVPRPDFGAPVPTDYHGNARFSLVTPYRRSLIGLRVYAQGLILDPLAPQGMAFTNALSGSMRWSVRSDFNGDGRADLAIGAPGDNSSAGEVNIIYGSDDGLSSGFTQIWHQDSKSYQGNVAGKREPNDKFGAALASGDFDGDGYADLAIGVPGENLGAGLVNVLYGGPDGLQYDRNRYWSQNSVGIPGRSEPGDGFGSALATGDLNGDGYDDLAIGVPGENVLVAGVLNVVDLGTVNVLYGGPRGLRKGVPSGVMGRNPAQ